MAYFGIKHKTSSSLLHSRWHVSVSKLIWGERICYDKQNDYQCNNVINNTVSSQNAENKILALFWSLDGSGKNAVHVGVLKNYNDNGSYDPNLETPMNNWIDACLSWFPLHTSKNARILMKIHTKGVNDHTDTHINKKVLTRTHRKMRTSKARFKWIDRHTFPLSLSKTAKKWLITVLKL